MEFESFVSSCSSTLVTWLSAIIPYLSTISIAVNCCHVVILSRDSVTASSMNTLLIGIAVVDILCPVYYVKLGIFRVWRRFWTDVCEYPQYPEVLSDWLLGGLNDDFRRCSTWLGLVLAAVRTVAVKLAAKRNFNFISEPRFGRRLIVATVILSSLLAIPWFLRWQVVESDPHFCSSVSSGSVVLTTKWQLLEFRNQIPINRNARRVHILLTGILGQLIPVTLFPILAGILIVELRKPDKKMSTGVKTERISMMVVYMTVCFVVIELPIGIGKMVNALQTGTSTVPHDVNQIFHFIYVPMTMFHAFICFSMSSQYRHTFFRLTGLDAKWKPKASSTSLYLTSSALVSR